MLVGDGRTNGLGMGVARNGARLVDVAHVKHGLVGEQIQIGRQLAVLLLQLHGAGAQALFQSLLVTGEYLEQSFGRLVARHGLLLALAYAALHRLQILQLQLGIDYALVAHRIDGAVHMGDIAVVETAQNMNYGVGITYVAEEFVTQTLAFRRALHQSRYVDYLDGGGNDFLRVVYFSQLHQPLVGHRNDAHVGFDGTEREIGCLRLSVRQTVEKGRFADVGQTDYTALQSHLYLFFRLHSSFNDAKITFFTRRGRFGRKILHSRRATNPQPPEWKVAQRFGAVLFAKNERNTYICGAMARTRAVDYIQPNVRKQLNLC